MSIRKKSEERIEKKTQKSENFSGQNCFPKFCFCSGKKRFFGFWLFWVNSEAILILYDCYRAHKGDFLTSWNDGIIKAPEEY